MAFNFSGAASAAPAAGTAAPAASPFAGFGTTAPAAGTAAPAPAAPATGTAAPATGTPAPAAGGFNFGGAAPAAGTAATGTTGATTAGTTTAAPGGFGFGGATGTTTAAATPAGASLPDVHLKGKTLSKILHQWDQHFTEDFHAFQMMSNNVQARDRDMLDHGNLVLGLIQSVEGGIEEAKATQRTLDDLQGLQKALVQEVQRLEDRVNSLYNSSRQGRGRTDEAREGMYQGVLRLFDEVQQIDMATERLMTECNVMKGTSRNPNVFDPLDSIVTTVDWHLATIGRLQQEADDLQNQLRRAGVWHDAIEGSQRGLHLG